MQGRQCYPVVLYLYDLSGGLAKAMSMSLIQKQVDGIWHSSLNVYNQEFFYGGGICWSTPKQTPYGQPVQEIAMGETPVTLQEFQDYLKSITWRFSMDKYDLINNNCNNFTDEISKFLLGKRIPAHITGLPQELLQTNLGKMFEPMVQGMMNQMNQMFQGMQSQPNTELDHSQLFEDTPLAREITCIEDIQNARKNYDEVIILLWRNDIDASIEMVFQLKAILPPKKEIFVMDTRKNPCLVYKFQASQSIPTFIILKDENNFQKSEDLELVKQKLEKQLDAPEQQQVQQVQQSQGSASQQNPQQPAQIPQILPQQQPQQQPITQRNLSKYKSLPQAKFCFQDINIQQIKTLVQQNFSQNNEDQDWQKLYSWYSQNLIANVPQFLDSILNLIQKDTERNYLFLVELLMHFALQENSNTILSQKSQLLQTLLQSLVSEAKTITHGLHLTMNLTNLHPCQKSLLTLEFQNKFVSLLFQQFSSTEDITTKKKILQTLFNISGIFSPNQAEMSQQFLQINQDQQIEWICSLVFQISEATQNREYCTLVLQSLILFLEGQSNLAELALSLDVLTIMDQVEQEYALNAQEIRVALGL